MDHRCLYGHRISQEYRFAISQRTCPMCGAPSVTLEGYQMARMLATGVPLDAVEAFNAVRLLEGRYTFAIRPNEVEEDEDAEVSVAEIEIDESDVTQEESYVAHPEPAPEPTAVVPVRLSKPTLSADEPMPAPVLLDDVDDSDVTEAEKSFFSE